MVSLRLVSVCVALAVALHGTTLAAASNAWIPPFSRVLSVQTPMLQGADVNVTQHLVVRDAAVSMIPMTGEYDTATANAVRQFQSGW